MSDRTDTASYAQSRLALFARLMFWSFVGLRIGEVALYQTTPDVTPEHYRTIVVIGIGTLLLLAGMRWLVLVRHVLRPAQLQLCDLIMMTGCGVAFGTTAMLAWNRPESAYTCLIYAAFMVMMRTIVVPSSPQRTAVIASIALAPLVVAAAYLALESVQDVPGPAFFAGGVMYSSVTIAVAATGSRVIYGLRREVKQLVGEGVDVGQYRLIRRVGSGPIGEVFVARHALLRRPTAVKIVPPEAGADVLARCEQAVQKMSQLRNPSTVAIYDYGRSPDGAFYFAMEYLEGISLDAVLDVQGTLPLPRVLAILQQLCASLHEAHERGLAHGNLVPANVILCDRGGLADVVKVSDFGFAREPATPVSDLATTAALASKLLGGHIDELAACFEGSTTARDLGRRLSAHPQATWSQADARQWWSELRRSRG